MTLCSKTATASEPRCPRCGWTLRFEARDLSWVAHCWNKRPPNPCPVDVVPPSINTELVEYLSDGKDHTAPEVAKVFDWSDQNANNHLQALLRLGIVTRQRIKPAKGGKLYVWRLA